ncbi:hypothetical protein LTR53_016229 [Teratosphaeriaceae sp. CCFEE 6253]|nr:hypothetical protein LTR53_016229 [Teratosphaeriaceae sp. CCFEE 6253]
MPYSAPQQSCSRRQAQSTVSIRDKDITFQRFKIASRLQVKHHLLAQVDEQYTDFMYNTANMLLRSAVFTAGSLAISARAQSSSSASVTIEASHGGAGSGLTNTTITVPLNTTYSDPALDTVSSLYLTGATGSAVESITCTPYRYANGTGAGGLPFTYGAPSRLSTNTVQVGSIVCVSSASSTTSSNGTGVAATLSSISATSSAYTNASTSSTTSLSSSTSTASGSASTTPLVGVGMTSTLLTTIIPSAGASNTLPITSTITSVVGAPTGTPPTVTTTPSAQSASSSTTTSAAAGLSTGNAADSLPVTEGAWFGLAIAALGLAMMA